MSDFRALHARSQRTIFLFWAPLAAQWVMMALEGPFLAAVIARMGDPAYNLAAYGIAFALAILVESPVIMLMSAATALVEDGRSYRRLRNFANALNAGATLLLLLILVPFLYDLLMRRLLGLPGEVVDLAYGALWLLLPWPAAIGYRRFLHGVLIRSGLTRRVAYGTVVRLAAMSVTALVLYATTGLPGAWVGGAALSAGVLAEAVAARAMAAGAIRELLHGGTLAAPTGRVVEAEPIPERPVIQPAAASAGAEYMAIARFYYPLALTSFIALTVQPLLTFLMGRAPAPVESLAVFPVVHALSFLFRAASFSYQEVVIALAGRHYEHARQLVRFGAMLAVLTAGGLALVAFTPLARIWFGDVSGLPADLAALAIAPTRIAVLLPSIAVLVAFQQGLLVLARDTPPITVATIAEVLIIAATFVIFGWVVGMTGVSAAMLALLCGRAAGSLVLVRPVRRALARSRPGPAA
jgi:progressive ankylosis protein